MEMEKQFEKLTDTDKKILGAMLVNKLGFTGFQISRHTGISYNHVLFRLRMLIAMNIVRKSITKKYFILPSLKDYITENNIIPEMYMV